MTTRAKKSTAVVPVVTGDVIVPGEDRLPLIAEGIRAEFGKGIDAQFAIGRLLIEAHAIMPDDRVYGAWVASQNFPFKKGTAFLLQRGAEREPEVREFIAARVQENERDIGVPYAIQLLTAPKDERVAVSEKAREVGGLSANSRTDSAFNRWKFATREFLGVTVADDEDATVVWPERPFEHLHVDDLVEAADLIKLLVMGYQNEKAARAVNT